MPPSSWTDFFTSVEGGSHFAATGAQGILRRHPPAFLGSWDNSVACKWRRTSQARHILATHQAAILRGEGGNVACQHAMSWALYHVLGKFPFKVRCHTFSCDSCFKTQVVFHSQGIANGRVALSSPMTTTYPHIKSFQEDVIPPVSEGLPCDNTCKAAANSINTGRRCLPETAHSTILQP